MTKAQTTYFDQDFLDFFKELAANNHKDWFDANRKRYEKSVKEPFKAFVSDLIGHISKNDQTIQIRPEDAIFRINRDIRFSPDKAPYKLDRSAIISPAGRKDHSTPGFYISLGPEFLQMGGGAYSLNTHQLKRVRSYICENPHRFEERLSNPEFQKCYDGVKGEEHKRLPREYQAAALKQPLLYKKQFYYMTKKSPELITSQALMLTAMNHYKAALPLQEFLAEAVE